MADDRRKLSPQALAIMGASRVCDVKANAFEVAALYASLSPEQAERMLARLFGPTSSEGENPARKVQSAREVLDEKRSSRMARGELLGDRMIRAAAEVRDRMGEPRCRPADRTGPGRRVANIRRQSIPARLHVLKNNNLE